MLKNQYYNEMVQMLMLNPQGMRVGVIARAVYNASCDLFDGQGSSRFRNIYAAVRRYLWQQSQRRQSPFKRLGWGIYALRQQFVRQLELTFDEWEDDGPPPRKQEAPKHQNEPYMLNLFGW